jgi:hypothetical protein
MPPIPKAMARPRTIPPKMMEKAAATFRRHLQLFQRRQRDQNDHQQSHRFGKQTRVMEALVCGGDDDALPTKPAMI